MLSPIGVRRACRSRGAGNRGADVSGDAAITGRTISFDAEGFHEGSAQFMAHAISRPRPLLSSMVETRVAMHRERRNERRR
jgi:hypothetical protein